jgi:hypothetical protein
MENTIYVAIDKVTKKAIGGVKGQYAFGDRASLGRSMGQVFGKGSKERYDIHEIDLNEVLNLQD